MRELYRSEYFVLTADDDQRIVRRTRTDRRFETDADLELAYESLLRALVLVDRHRYGLLVDLRLAPPRNDPAFEQLVMRYQARLYAGFRRMAILAKTEAGRLQLTRLLGGKAIRYRVFVDEQAAIAYLLDPAEPDRF